MNTLRDKYREILDEWLDKAMSTSSLGYSIDGYKGMGDKSDAVAEYDYDKYKAEAIDALLSATLEALPKSKGQGDDATGGMLGRNDTAGYNTAISDIKALLGGK